MADSFPQATLSPIGPGLVGSSPVLPIFRDISKRKRNNLGLTTNTLLRFHTSTESSPSPPRPAMLSRQALRSLRAAAPQRTLARSSVRSYAAAAAQDVKPPVSIYGLDGTYATALVRFPAQIASRRCS